MHSILTLDRPCLHIEDTCITQHWCSIDSL